MRLNQLPLAILIFLSACASLPPHELAERRCGNREADGWRFLSEPHIDQLEILELAQRGNESFTKNSLFWYTNSEKQILLCRSPSIKSSERKLHEPYCNARLWKFEQTEAQWQEQLAPVIVCHR